MQDISGFGTRIQISASNTFPFGFNLSAFSDDVDPIDVPSVQIAEGVMGANGDLITWSKANPIKTTISVIPNSDEDINLSILLEANRVGKGKQSARDVMTMTAIFPDGSILTLIEGIITDGMPGNSFSNAGRLKTKTYSFSFENRIIS